MVLTLVFLAFRVAKTTEISLQKMFNVYSELRLVLIKTVPLCLRGKRRDEQKSSVKL